MALPYQLFIAFRYLKSRKRHKGISFNTVISTGGVAVGVMALLVVLAVMTGFHEDLQKKILGVSANVVVIDYRGALSGYDSVIAKVKTDKEVLSASPFVLGQVMLSYGGKGQGVYLRGIDVSGDRATTDIANHIKRAAKDLASNDGPPGIL